MINFEEAREKMIKTQLIPTGVRNNSVLEHMLQVPRELFVPEEFKIIAYSAKEIPLAQGRSLLEPMLAGKFLQATHLVGTERVLVLGDGTGYMTALFSMTAKSVVIVERSELIDTIKGNLEKLNFGNVVCISGDISQGAMEYAPFDIIYINGSVQKIPEKIMEQLAPDGTLFTMMKRGYICDAVKYKKMLDEVNKEVMFECSANVLPEFATSKKFKF